MSWADRMYEADTYRIAFRRLVGDAKSPATCKFGDLPDGWVGSVGVKLKHLDTHRIARKQGDTAWFRPWEPCHDPFEEVVPLHAEVVVWEWFD